MKINTVSVLLTYYREKYHLSQIQLCDGICSITTYSRIEQGYREVDSLTSQTLVERIGKHVLEFELLLNEEDYHRMVLREKINQELKKENYKEADRLLEQYRIIMPGEEILHRQFYLCGKAQIELYAGVDKEKAIEMLKEALHLTKPEENVREEQLYSEIEIKTAFLIACFETDEEWAEKEMLKLLNFIGRYCSNSDKERLGLPILRKLIGMKQEKQDDVALVGYLDRAICVISESNGIAELAELHFQKAKALERLYRIEEDWDEQTVRPPHFKQCIEECIMAYHVADVMEFENLREEIKKFSGEQLKWQITE